MEKNANAYLTKLFNNKEIDLLQYIFNHIFFLEKDIAIKYEKENNFIRNCNCKLYMKGKDSYIQLRNSKNSKANRKKISTEGNLFMKNSLGEFENIRIDSTGNYAPKKFLDVEYNFKIDRSNYKISHLENKPTTPKKHGFKNIVIIPSFLDHFIDKNISLDGKIVTNVAKQIAINLYDLDSDFFCTPNISEEEKSFASSIIPKILERI